MLSWRRVKWLKCCEFLVFEQIPSVDKSLFPCLLRVYFVRQTVSIDETVFLLSGQTHKTYRLIPLHKAHNHITANQDLKNESAEGK